MKITLDISEDQAQKINEISELKKLAAPDVLLALAQAGLTYAINETLRVERERAGIRKPQPIGWRRI